MYKIDIDLANKDSNDSTKEALGIMVDLLETINCVDDVPTFSIKMKLLNNIEFIVDNLMDNYIHGK
jgi:hypothetical protein